MPQSIDPPFQKYWNGLSLIIENPVGSTRSGQDDSGKFWKIKLSDHYGFIKNTEGEDGEGVDVFVNPQALEHLDQIDSPIYVIHQVIDGEYDEDKVMLGYPDAETAQAAYCRNYSKDCDLFGGMDELNEETFMNEYLKEHWKPKAKYSKEAALQKRCPRCGSSRPQLKKPNKEYAYCRSCGWHGRPDEILVPEKGTKTRKPKAMLQAAKQKSCPRCYSSKVEETHHGHFKCKNCGWKGEESEIYGGQQIPEAEELEPVESEVDYMGPIGPEDAVTWSEEPPEHIVDDMPSMGGRFIPKKRAEQQEYDSVSDETEHGLYDEPQVQADMPTSQAITDPQGEDSQGYGLTNFQPRHKFYDDRYSTDDAEQSGFPMEMTSALHSTDRLLAAVRADLDGLCKEAADFSEESLEELEPLPDEPGGSPLSPSQFGQEPGIKNDWCKCPNCVCTEHNRGSATGLCEGCEAGWHMGTQKTGSNPSDDAAIAKGTDETKASARTKEHTDSKVPRPCDYQAKKASRIDLDLLKGLNAAYERYLEEHRDDVLHYLHAVRSDVLDEIPLPNHATMQLILSSKDLTGIPLLEATKERFWNEFITAELEAPQFLDPRRARKLALWLKEAPANDKYQHQNVPEQVLLRTIDQFGHREEDEELTAEDSALLETMRAEEKRRGNQDREYEVPETKGTEIKSAGFHINAVKATSEVEFDPNFFDDTPYTQAELTLGALIEDNLQTGRPRLEVDTNLLRRKATKQLEQDLREIKGPYTVHSASQQRLTMDKVGSDGVVLKGQLTWHVRFAAHNQKRMGAVELPQDIIDGEPQPVTQMVTTAGAVYPFERQSLAKILSVPARRVPDHRRPKVELSFRSER
jgi:ribosomal protein L37AE/L43A